MAATLRIIHTFQLLSDRGGDCSGKHGTNASNPKDPLKISLDGKRHHVASDVANEGNVVLWENAENDEPTTFDLMYFWADQDVWLEFIDDTDSVAFLIRQYVPFSLGYDDISITPADTTPSTGATAPTNENIDKINVHNVSGETSTSRCV